MEHIAKSVISSLVAESSRGLTRDEIEKMKNDMMEAISRLDSSEILKETESLSAIQSKKEEDARDAVMAKLKKYSDVEPIYMFEKMDSFEEQLEYLKMYVFDESPELILKEIQVNSLEEAAMVAKVFKAKLGPMVFCGYTSYCMESYYTIMDCIKFRDFDKLYNEAFKNAGFKYSWECDSRFLANAYGYYSLEKTLLTSFSYYKIEESNQWLNEELQQYLFHPSRAQKWLEDGHDIEDYMS